MWWSNESKSPQTAALYQNYTIQLSQINKKIDHLSEQINNHFVSQERIATLIDSHHEQLMALNGTVNGNGKPGLRDRLNWLEQSRNSVIWAIGIFASVASATLGALLRHMWPIP